MLRDCPETASSETVWQILGQSFLNTPTHMLNDYYNHWPESDGDIKQLVTQFEEMQRNKKPVYFDIEDLISISEYYLYNNKLEKSLSAIKYAHKIHPDSLEVNLYYCRTLLADGQIDKATSIANSLSEQDDREVIFLRAEILLLTNQIEKADILFEKLAADEHYSKEVIVDITNVYIDNNMMEEAYRWISMQYQKTPNDKEVRTIMMECTFYLEDFEQCIDLANALLDDNPYNIYHWITLIKCYLETFQNEKMCEAIEFALSIDNTQEELLQVAGRCYVQTRNYEKANDIFLRLLEMDPTNMEAINGLSVGLTSVGDFETAIIYQTKAIDNHLPLFSDKEKAFLYQQRAFSYIMTKNLDKCKSDIEESLKYDEHNCTNHLTAAMYYLATSDNDKVLEEAGRAEMCANDEDSMKEVLMFYFQNTFFEETIRLGKKLEEKLGKKAKKYSYIMAYSYYALEDKSEEMIKHMVRAIEYNPKLLTIHEESPFVELAKKIKRMIDEGIINKEDYLF